MLPPNSSHLIIWLLQAEGPAVCDAVKAGLLDLYLTKFWAIKFASQAATTVLKVDQVDIHSSSW